MSGGVIETLQPLGDFPVADAKHIGFVAGKSVSTALTDLSGSLSSWTAVAGADPVAGNFVRYTDGQVLENVAYNYQSFSVTAGSRVRISAAIVGNQTALAVFLKANGAYLGFAEQAISGSTTVYTDHELVVPAGAERLVISQQIARNATNPMTVKTAMLEAAVPSKIAEARAVADAAGAKAAVVVAALTTATALAGTLHPGEYVNASDGVPVPLAGYSWKEFAISGGEVLRLSATAIGASTALAVFKDAAGNFISYVDRSPSGTPAVYTDFEIKAPANAASVILCQQNVYDATTPMTVKAVTMETQVSAKIAAAHHAASTASTRAGTALEALTYLSSINGTVHAGEYVAFDSGTPIANSGYSWKEFPVAPGDVLRVTATTIGGSTALAVFLDGSGGFISYVNRAPGGGVSTAYVDHEIAAPAGAAKVLLCQQTAFNSTTPMTVKRAAIATSVAADLATLKGTTQALEGSATATANELAALKDGGTKNTAAISEFAAVSGGALTNGSYIDRVDGSIKAHASYSYQSWDVTAGELIRLSARISGGSTALACWYAANGAYLGYSIGAPSGASQLCTDELVQVPANATKLFMSQQTAYQAATPMTVKRGTRTYTLPARVKALEEGGGNAYWKGKTVAWYGNSIPTGGYPNQLAEALGFTLYRETTGGMAYRAGVRSLVTGSDPYGWTGRSWTGLMWSLGMNLAEKQYLIDNWATLRSILSNSPPETLSQSQINQALAASYENRLVANHLGANRRDWYIFDNPFNDRGMANDLATAGVGSEDRLTYLGTMNLLIRLILEDNPGANIAMIGHYENQRDPGHVAAQKIVTDHWSIPFFPLHEKLGWSQRQITVNGSWGDAGNGLYQWIEGTGVQTMTVLNRLLPDGVHPAAEVTGARVRQTTDAILPWLRDLR